MQLPQTLLEKIEELTLYTLDLNRKQNSYEQTIKSQQEEIRELKEELSAVNSRMERLEALVARLVDNTVLDAVQ